VVLLYAPGWYMVCQIVAREIVTIWGLRQVFRRFQVSLHPLHPDRCGGLRAINNYAVGFTYIVAIVGIGVGLMVYSTLRRFVVAVTVPLVPAMVELAAAIGSALLRSE
jgi:hypothetical protein